MKTKNLGSMSCSYQTVLAKRECTYGKPYNNKTPSMFGRRPKNIGKYSGSFTNGRSTIFSNFDGCMNAIFDKNLEGILTDKNARHMFYILIDEKLGWKQRFSAVYSNYKSKSPSEITLKRIEQLKNTYKETFKDYL